MRNRDPRSSKHCSAIAEGIRKAKAKGIRIGRPPSIDPAPIVELALEGMKPNAIAYRLGIARSSVFRIVNKMRADEAAAKAATKLEPDYDEGGMDK